MSLMINQNITSLNAWRNLGKTDREMSKTMEKLSSGLRINRAADDPSGLIISEQMRAQVVGLKAAVKNSEKGISMIQTAEGALDKVHVLLDKMRGLALDSANSATADDNMLAANQAEIDNIIETIRRISDDTQYGTKKLLNGDNANTATVTNAAGTGITTANVVEVNGLDDGIYNLAVTVNTPGAGVLTDTDSTGAALAATSTSAATAAALSEGTHTLTIAGTTYEDTGDLSAGASTKADGTTAGDIAATGGGFYAGAADATFTFTSATAGAYDAATTFTLTYDDGNGTTGTATWVGNTSTFTDVTGNLSGATLAFTAGTFSVGETFDITMTASKMTASLDGGAAVQLVSNADNSSVALTSGLTDGGTIAFNLDNVLATGAGTASIAVAKTTYDATLTEAATGTSGTVVTGFKASEGEQIFTVGTGKSMKVNMSGLTLEGATGTLATIQFDNADESLVFQVGANQGQTVKIAIQDVSPEMLAANITNVSNFASLQEINIDGEDTAQKARDALTLIDKAIDQISVIRGDLGAFQANTLEANLDSLRVAAENLQASESVIRDTDMAAEMATFTKYQIMMQAGTAMLAQANQMPQNILQLLQG